MNDEPDILASLRFSPIRARIPWALMDSARRPARRAGLRREYLSAIGERASGQMVGGGLLASEAQGRHRYFRIVSAEVADAIESSRRSAWRSRHALHVAAAVEVGADPVSFPHLLRPLGRRDRGPGLRGDVESAVAYPGRARLRVTRLGKRWRRSISISPPCASRGVFLRACVDLTQRRPHIQGALGAALLRRAGVDSARAARASSPSRPRAGKAFRRVFGLNRL